MPARSMEYRNNYEHAYAGLYYSNNQVHAYERWRGGIGGQAC